jgi:hypothetical protein
MPASYNHHSSISKAWKDWKAACLSRAGSDICSEDELLRRARALGIPAAQLLGSHVLVPTQSVSWSAAWKRFRSIRTNSPTQSPSRSGSFSIAA